MATMFKLPCPVHDRQGRSGISSMVTLPCQYCLLNVDITSYRMLLPSYHFGLRGIPGRTEFLHPRESAIVPYPIHLALCSNVRTEYVYVSRGLPTRHVSLSCGRPWFGEPTFFLRQLLQPNDDVILRRVRPRTRWDHVGTNIFEFFVFEDTYWTPFHIDDEALV